MTAAPTGYQTGFAIRPDLVVEAHAAPRTYAPP